MLRCNVTKARRRDTHLCCCVQSKVAAVHACVPELKRRRAELEAELAMIIAQHKKLTDELPWDKQLVRPHFMQLLNFTEISNPMQLLLTLREIRVLQSSSAHLADLCCKFRYAR